MCVLQVLNRRFWNKRGYNSLSSARLRIDWIHCYVNHSQESSSKRIFSAGNGERTSGAVLILCILSCRIQSQVNPRIFLLWTHKDNYNLFLFVCLFVCLFSCCPVNCVMNSWTSWGNCSAKCEMNGYQARTRSVRTQNSCGGTSCPSLRETKACRGGCCKRDCIVSNWGSWGKCNAPAGKCNANSGTRSRSRMITRQPTCGGNACPSTSDSQQCTPVPITCQVRLKINFREW